MEQLGTALQTRRPAPAFSPGYKGPGAFLTDNPYGNSKSDSVFGGMDDDDKRDLKARKLFSGATQGGAIGSTTGSIAALLASMAGNRFGSRLGHNHTA